MPRTLTARSIDGLLDDVFRQYRAYFLPLFLTSLVLIGPVTIINAMIGAYIPAQNSLFSMLQNQGDPQQLMAQMAHNQAILRASIGPYLLQILVSLLAANIVTPLTNGVYYLIGSDTLTGRDLDGTVGFYIGRAAKRWPSYLATLWLLIGLGIAAYIIIVIAGVLLALAFSLLGHVSTGLQAIGVLIGLILVVALFGVTVWLSIRLQFTFVAVVLERIKNWSAIRRTWTLTAGAFWRIFLITVLATIVLSIASSGLTAVIELFVKGTSLQVLATGLISIFIAPIYQLLLANLYVDQRIRKEGYDLEMQLDQEGSS